jgi:glutamyl endopeptidase
MVKKIKNFCSKGQRKDSNSSYSDSSLEENKHADAENSDYLSSTDPVITSSLVGLDSSILTRTTQAKSIGSRSHFVDSDEESDEEAILCRIKLGEDGREYVPDTTILPFSTQGRIIVRFKEVEIRCSGTLIGSKYVLTAAHNLIYDKYNSEPLSGVFIPGLNGDQTPFGEIKVKRYFYPFEYKSYPTEDYGLIELEEEIGNSAGFIEMKMLRADEIRSLEISLYGYPSRMKDELNFCMYGMSGKAKLNERNGLEYELDADKGQSGSCVYYYSPEDEKYYTIGVHVKGYDTHNEATFLTSERVDQIQKWMDNKVLDTKHNLGESNTQFYGRDSELMRLRNSMRSDIDKSVIVLFGVAGIGKTTIALKFAKEAIGGYHYIWWIDATTEDSFIDSVNFFGRNVRNNRFH